MSIRVNDRVIVTKRSLATYNQPGLVTNVVYNPDSDENLVSVLLDQGSVQYRSGNITKIVKYNESSLELLDQPSYDWSNEYSGPVVAVWKNEDKPSLLSAKLDMYMYCTDVEDCKRSAAIHIEQDPDAFYWVSITRPSQVEIYTPEPTIRKVNEEEY